MRLLVMCYVDCAGQKGDAIRLDELVRGLSGHCAVTLIAVNAHSFKGRSIARLHSVPKFGSLMVVSWNICSVLYAIWSVLTVGADLIYADMAPGSVAPAFVSLFTRTPLVVELNGPVGAQDIALYRRRSRLKLALARMMERIMARRARLVLGAEGWIRLAREVFHLPPGRVAVLPLAVNHCMFRPADMAFSRRALHLPANDRIVLFVGNVEPWQGLNTLITAAPHILRCHPRTHFIVVGDGSAAPKLRTHTEAERVAHAFRFVGSVPYAEVSCYMTAVDVAVAIFPGNRGQPGGVSSLKTLQYLASGCPVVATTLEELAAAIETNMAGHSIPPRLAGGSCDRDLLGALRCEWGP